MNLLTDKQDTWKMKVDMGSFWAGQKRLASWSNRKLQRRASLQRRRSLQGLPYKRSLQEEDDLPTEEGRYDDLMRFLYCRQNIYSPPRGFLAMKRA